MPDNWKGWVYRMQLANGTRRMNPSTLLRLFKAWEGQEKQPAHILMIGALSGCWPSTVYAACALGYVYRTESAHFLPTERLMVEVRRVRELREQVNV